MLTVLTLLKVGKSPNGHLHGERDFWREMGDVYLAAWLENVRKYVPEPKRVIVMTDEPMRVADTHRVGTVALDREVNAPGFWAKLEMFRRGVGKTLYMDLDNVITGPLDALCDLTPDPLIMLDDRRVPRLPNGSTILFDAERCRDIWRRYVLYKDHHERRFVARGDDYSMAYDQAFIAANFVGGPPLFQDLLPKDYCLNAVAELPHAEDWRDSRLIFGGGASGKPHRMNHPAIAEHWHA
jgi:hypothetical protein